MKVAAENITQVIPQRPPFVMIGALENATEDTFETTTLLLETNIFNKAGVIQEPALIENIAQTCAAGFGYMDSKSGQPPKVGFIGALTKMTIHSLPSANTMIRTRVVVTHQLDNIYLMKGENQTEDGEPLVQCEIKIVVQG